MGHPAWKTNEVLARLALRRHGAVSHGELLAAGLTPATIRHLVISGVLARVHRGVYLVGVGPSAPLAREAAALLACRPRAILGHPSSTRLHRLPIAVDDATHVIVVGRWRRGRDGVRVRTIGHLSADELRYHQGLPIASPALSLLDLAGDGDADELLECVHEARVRKLVTDRELRATLRAHPNRRGARALRCLLDTEGGVRVTRSRAERRTLKVMRRHGLEPDASDYPVGPYRLDFFFSRERVAVEYDSRQYHDNDRRFVADRRKAAYLAARGIITFPLTAQDVGAGAERAMAHLRATLRNRRP